MYDQIFFSKQLIRKTNYFNDDKFKQFTQDIQKEQINQITDVQIQCRGYGNFNKPKLLNNFFSYVRGITTFCKNIKIFKIQLHGFDLPQHKIIPKICQDISKNLKQNIKVLWFHTGQLTNCLLDDFQSILQLISELSHINFQEISLQFSRWIFVKAQPNLFELEDCFSRLLKNAEFNKINNQKFRLQISSWYYDHCTAKSFLKFKCRQNQILKTFNCRDSQQLQRKKVQNNQIAKKVSIFQNGQFHDQGHLPMKIQEFHKKMEYFIKNLLEMMDHVKEFEIDFRNWNQLLKMKNLQKKLNNITKKDTYEKSIVSKRIGLEDHQNQTQLRMIFVM